MDLGRGARKRRLGVGDEDAAFEEAFLEYYEEVFRLAYRILGSPDEAEDVAQEVFVRLHRQGLSDGRLHNVRGWLYRVATNLSYNAARASARRASRQERASELGTVAPSVASDPQGRAERREEADLVRQALSALTHRQRRLLMLRYAGLSYRELADAVRVAPGSVGTLLARAEAAFEAAYVPLTGIERGE